MARAFLRDGEHVEALLDASERAIVADLVEQVLELVRPHAPAASGDGDDFDAIVAGLGPGFGRDLGLGEGGAQDGDGGLGGRGFGLPEERDPVLDRLFPAGHREDEQAAAEYRRLTEDGLRARKSVNLATALECLTGATDGKVRLDRRRAVAMLVALTDVRLVVADRLGIRTDEDAERVHELVDVLPMTNPAIQAMAVYDFLTWLQEGLAAALLPR